MPGAAGSDGNGTNVGNDADDADGADGGKERTAVKRPSLRQTFYSAGIVAAAVLFALGATRFVPVLRSAESHAGDLLHLLAYPRGAPAQSIVLVTITEETLAGLPYRSPIDRGFLADLIAGLAEKRPAAIGVDVIFDQPSDPAKDARLRTTLLAHRELPVVVAVADAASGLTEAQVAHQVRYLDGVPKGFATLVKDADTGVVQWLFPGKRLDGRYVPGLPVALAAARGVRPPDPPIPFAFQLGPDPERPRFPVYPAHRAHLIPADWIAGRVVLIGGDLPHADRHPTPQSVLRGQDLGARPGVFLHAQAVAQLLEGRRLVVADGPARVALALAAALLGLAAIAAPAGVAVRLGLLGLALAGIWAGAAGLLSLQGVRVPVLAPTLACALVAGAIGTRAWIDERRQRSFIRSAFSRYVAPAVVDQLLADPQRLRLGGERREVTVIFTDVAGFTGLSERLPPETLSATLNAYLSGMSGLVFQHRATLDKFIGDAVVAFFGAPIARADHADAAVRLALALDAYAADFAERMRRERGIDFGLTRIGVHTGLCTVGNFGGADFFDYTVIGDTVNVAARLESANKAVGTRVLISESTAAQAPGLPMRPVGRLVLKGRSKAIGVFQPVDPADPAAAGLADYRAAYADMAAGRASARQALAELAMQRPADRLVRFHHARLAAGARGDLIELEEK